jgi:hypothetical protein
MSLSVTARVVIMRLKLGLAVAFSSVASVLALVAPAQAQTTTVPDSATTTTTTTTTTATTTTTPGPDFSLPANSSTGRRIVYSKSLQKVWVTNSAGALIKEHRISGRLRWCNPLPGQYQVLSRSRYTFALANPAIIWGYMVRFTKGCDGGNIGFHEIPTNKNTGYKVQSMAQLGIPLSGGCVRQAESDAI